MKKYSLTKAKNNFENIIDMIINKEENCIVLTRNNKTIAKIVPYKKRYAGCLKNKYEFKDVDWFDNEITDLFINGN